MAHKDFRMPLQGGLKGTLPRALVRGEEVGLGISRQVYGQKVLGTPVRGLTGAIGPSGAQQPPGAAWSNIIFGSPLQTPTNPVPRLVSGTYNIQECVVLTEGGVGSCVISLWKANLSAHYPPNVGDDITGGHNIAIAGGTFLRDSTLAGWTLGLAQDDVLLFSLQSVATFSYIAIQLRIG